MRRTWRRLRSCSESQALAPGRSARRVLTSAKTSVRAVADDQVDLAVARAVVARHELEAEPPEVRERELFAAAAELLARIGWHRGRR